MSDLFVALYGRGKEIFGLTFKKEKFTKKLQKQVEDSYVELCDDNFLDLELPLSCLELSIKYNNSSKYYETYLESKIKVVSSGMRISYREMMRADDDEVAVMWYHIHSFSTYHIWRDIGKFHKSKLKIITSTRIDETDNTEYEYVSEILYDNRPPDETEEWGEPKIGFEGPFILY